MGREAMDIKVPDRIRREVEAEFPEDFALQQVHVARRLLALQARKAGGLTRYLENRRKLRAADPTTVAGPLA